MVSTLKTFGIGKRSVTGTNERVHGFATPSLFILIGLSILIALFIRGIGDPYWLGVALISFVGRGSTWLLFDLFDTFKECSQHTHSPDEFVEIGWHK